MLLFVYNKNNTIDAFWSRLNMADQKIGVFSVEELPELGLSPKVFPKKANVVECFCKNMSQGMLQRFQDYLPNKHRTFSAFFSDIIKSDRKNGTNMALLELVLREFARLGNPAQMKTRLAVDDDEELWIASKELPEYKNLLSYLAREDDEISNFIAQERLKEEIQNGTCKGLGYMLITALFSSEADFKIDNLGRNAEGHLVIHDIGWGLSFLRIKLFSASKITEPVIANLPAPPLGGSVYNWFAMSANGQMSRKMAFSDDLKNNPILRKEINEALLNILILPDSLVEEFVAYYTQAINKEFGAVLCETMLERKKALRDTAMLNPSFREYLNSQEAIDQFSKHQAYVCQFHLTGKDQFNLPDLETRLRDEFEHLQSDVKSQNVSQSSTSSMLLNILGSSNSSSPSSSMDTSVKAETASPPCASAPKEACIVEPPTINQSAEMRVSA